ncbi:MAG: hypothetical protein R2729_21460 [Bryobacteraceae bacterium]
MNIADYLRAIRGPVLLTALGILMMVDHAGRFDFGQSWPVLVVLYGVLVLAERLAQPRIAPPGGPSAPPPPSTPAPWGGPQS